MQELLVSKSRTTGESSRIQRGSHQALMLMINTTAIAASPSVDVFIEANFGDEWVTVFKVAAPITGVGKYVALVGLSLGAVQNDSYYDEVVIAPIPSTWRVRTQHADGDAITYSVSCSFVR